MSGIDKSIFLGGTEGPEPTWRDEAEDGTAWPEGAVFQIHFTPENTPVASVAVCAIPRIEFFGADGWPLDLPQARKTELSELMKLEFQVFPCNWRDWNRYEWDSAIQFPEHFAENRRAFPVLRAFARHM